MVSRDQSAMVAFVDRLNRRSSLSHAECGALLELRGRVSVARANIDIVSPGQRTDHACLVLDGMAGRFGQVANGQRQITALHIVGDMCDLHSIVAPRAGWALQALAPTSIMQVPHEQLLDIAQTYPNVARAFWRDCSVDASVLSQWLVNVGRLDARARLAHLICEMGVRMEEAALGVRTGFILDMSQDQIADALGLTPVHVNRTLKVLREEGVLELSRRFVRILDWELLVVIAEFDPHYLQIEPDAMRRAA